MMDLALVEDSTQALVDSGVRVFNGALFGDTEREHVALLLGALNPVKDAMVIDAGCGIGEMAALMREVRPDLQFLLVNVSQAQLDLCPPEFDRLRASFNSMPVPDACADAIVFSYSICHSEDWVATLEEARRVLKPGGILLINDMQRTDGDNEEFQRVLGACVHDGAEVEAWARGAGFGLHWALAPQVKRDHLAELLPADQAARLFAGIVPTIWRFEALDDIGTTLNRHDGHVAFQFSGGRDSTAALYLLRPHWGRISCVYHVDTGDQFPETRAVVDRVRADLKAAQVRFEVIHTDVAAQRDQWGYPSDLVPVDNTAIGTMVSGREMRLRGRYDCCAAALMNPLHARVLADEMTLLVRGQRDEEYAAPPMRSGDRADGIEVLYPIQSWTGEEVSSYLADAGLPVAPFYALGVKRAPECMGCTAWWDEGRAAYMREHHPAEHMVLVHRLHDIRAEINRQAAWLNNELEA